MNTHFLVKWIAVLALLSFVGATGPSAAPVRKGNYLLADWTGVDEQSGRCRFSFPGGYRRETQPDQVIYSVEGDNLSYQMHYFNTANVEYFGSTSAPAQPRSVDPATERLNQYATLLAQATNGQVVAQYVIYVSGRQGREVELTYTEPEGDQTIRMLSRFFWQNDMIHVFSVSAPTQYTNTLLDARNTYFNSIQFY